MQAKISKTLEGIIARVTFGSSKAAITHSLRDHLILEILRDEGSLAYQILSTRLKKWEIHQIQMRIDREIQIVIPKKREDPEKFFPRYTKELSRFFSAMESVSTAHVLLHVANDSSTLTAQALALYHISAHDISTEMQRFVLEEVQHHSEIQKSSFAPHTSSFSEADTTEAWERFGTDLTREARAGKIDPVIGRDREIERMVQILSRRKKNNPLLLGEAGVGKSAIVEGLALRMAVNDVPPTISGKRLYSLDIASLVARTKYRGEFEERMQKLLDQLRKERNTILFIDEIHIISGAGSTQGSLDTANMLKPALARGELQLIGATTLDEYRSDIEKDAALARRFQKIPIEAPSAEETLRILRDVAPRYERHHRVRYSDAALQRCVSLTERYIPDRNFPDKAIDVLDEAGARIYLQCNEEKHRDNSLRLHAESKPCKSTTKRSTTVDSTHRSTKKQSSKDSGIDPHPLPPLNEQPMPEVRAEHIEQVLTSMTGIPVERLSDCEQRRLRGLQTYLEERVIGQEEAVSKIARAIRRSRIGLREEGRPIGVFLFVGPTGVGKTLLAKELSRWLFNENQGLIRIDMSEYGEKHNVARLIGSPPGYVGYGDGGQLTEAVRRHPYSVILFDEIEKAHPEIFNTLLPLFDEGHLTDGSGRVVDFRNTVLIMTSNAGSRRAFAHPTPMGYSTPSRTQASEKNTHENYRKALEETFAPEFLNRIDEIVLFRSLELHDVKKIIDLELKGLLTRTGRLGYRLEITEEAKERLAQIGYEPHYGVRALRRTLIERIEDPLSGLIIEGKLPCGGRVILEPDSKQEIVLRVA